MTSILANLVPLLTAIGLGGLLGAYFQARFQRRAQIGQHEHELKQKRYLCILILMLTKLNPVVGLAKTRAIRPDLKTTEDIDDELLTELLNGFVYANDDVLRSLAEFIRTPDHQSFVRASVAMRKDLWGKRSSTEEIGQIIAVLSKLEEKP
jgi:hypothetical protein